MIFRQLVKKIADHVYNRLRSQPGIIAYLGDHRALVRTMSGQRLLVDTRDMSLAPELLTHGHWEVGVSTHLRRLLRPGMTVAEVGANIGYFSVLIASLVGPTGRVHCFEPNSHLAQLLRQSAEINGLTDQLTVIDKAAWSSPGLLDFYVLEKHMGSSSTSTSIHQTAELFHDRIDKVTVRAVTLDGYFPPGTKLDVLKVDAEGAELEVIRGARRLLEENPYIRLVMEFYPSNFSARSQAAELLDLLQSLGFQWREINLNDPAALLGNPTRERLLESRCAELLLQRANFPS